MDGLTVKQIVDFLKSHGMMSDRKALADCFRDITESYWLTAEATNQNEWKMKQRMLKAIEHLEN